MIKSALTLREDELKRLARYARDRVEAIEEARSYSWIPERERFESEWNDDFSHRGWESAVFAKSNESLNMIGSGVDYIRARMMDEIFGSKPWFAADFKVKGGREAGGEQVSSAKLLQHLRWKLGAIDFEGIAADLITQACKLGECIAKIYYKREEEVFERIARIAWNEGADAPLLTREGDFFIDGEYAPESLLRQLAGTRPEAEWSPGDDWQVRNGELPEGFVWREQIISERRVRFAGAKAVPLHFKEFYCPLDAPSLHEADFVAHRTKMRLSALRQHLGAGEEAGLPPSLAELQARVDGAAQKGTGTGQEEEEWGPLDPEVAILEAYFEVEIEGEPRRIYLMMALDYELPLYWDYIANVTPKGAYPFEAIVINKEPHRWFGKSWFRKYQKFQSLIDKLLNQILYRNELAANPVKFRRKEAVVQWQDDQPFEIGPDRVFDLNDGYSADDALQTSKIPELDEQTKYLLELVVSNWRTRSGVTTATQGAFGNLPSERTATGVTHIVEAGATIFKPQVMDVKRGLEAVLRQLVHYQYAYLQEDEPFAYVDGETRVEEMLYRGEVREVELEVELTLSRARQLRNLDAARMAVDFFGKFLNIPDHYKGVAAPLFAAIYKNLEIDNADEYFAKVVNITENDSIVEEEGGGVQHDA